MHTLLTRSGFTPALREGTGTHKDGNHLDQLWTRNIKITNAVVAELVDQVSDHYLIQVRMEATMVGRREEALSSEEPVDIRNLPQSTIRKIIKECGSSGLFESAP